MMPISQTFLGNGRYTWPAQETLTRAIIDLSLVKDGGPTIVQDQTNMLYLLGGPI